jgi:RimJ/RimL family protein N-acetyltransferase
MYTLALTTDLSLEQERQYDQLLLESQDETFFYGDKLDPKRTRQVVLNEDGCVVGAFEFKRMMYDGKYYWRTNRPYTLKAYRGRGIMGQVLKDWYAVRRPSIAWIDDENLSSIRLFASIGFQEERAAEMHGKQGHFYVLT